MLKKFTNSRVQLVLRVVQVPLLKAMVLLLALMAFVMLNDIIRIVTG